MTTSLDELLASLTPVLHPGVYVFCSAATAPAGIDAVATIREEEGVTLVLEESVARANGFEPRFRAAWITLGVVSDCADVGLTAAVSAALANAGIACNIIAAVHHDHLFVPSERGNEALAILQALARGR